MADKPWKTIRVTREMVVPDELKLLRCERSPGLGPRILFFSGGSAVRDLARSIVKYTHNSIHILTPFDSGGSSAILRKAFGMLSVGDIRARIMDLADQSIQGNPDVYKLFLTRFPKDTGNDELRQRLAVMIRGEDPLVAEIPDPMRKIIRSHLTWFARQMPLEFDLRGASIGNLILTGGFLNADRHIDPVIFTFSKLVEARGIVRPVTGGNLHLRAMLSNGTLVCGQHLLTGKEVPAIEYPIVEIGLTDDCEAGEARQVRSRSKVTDLIDSADLIVFPMGSFWSSLIANLLPAGIGSAIARNPCPKVYIHNTGNDPEQIGMKLSDCVSQILKYIRKDCGENTPAERLLNHVLVDPSATYGVELDSDGAIENGVDICPLDLISGDRHDRLSGGSLARVLVSIC